MEVYESPSSNIEDSIVRHRPVRGLIKSFLVSTLGVMIVSAGFSVAFGLIIGADITLEDNPNSFVYTNNTYMLLSTVVSVVVLFWSGWILGKHLYMNFNEWGLFLITISVCVYLMPYLVWDLENYSPDWYMIISWVSIPLAIFLGVKVQEKI